MIDQETPAWEKSKIRADLLDYCRRDTEAMVQVLTGLQKLAGVK